MERAGLDLMASTAARQHGILTSKQADALLGKSRKAYWVRTGRLVRAQPGTYRVAGSPISWHAELMAAQLSAKGLVSHRAAGDLWSLLRPLKMVEVSAAPGRHPRLLEPALCHRIKDLHVERGVRREGLLMTDPMRTLIDLGLVVPAQQVSDALSKALTTKLVRFDEVLWLRGALGRQGRNGTGIMGELLERRAHTGEREESVLEARFVDLLNRSSVRLPRLQFEVWQRGRFVARLDGAYPEVRLAVELDGYETRASPEALDRDVARQTRLVSLGWQFVRYTWRDVTRNPDRTVSTLLQTYARLAHSHDLSASLIT
jgi:very-short-patch-repair endonuclease